MGDSTPIKESRYKNTGDGAEEMETNAHNEHFASGNSPRDSGSGRNVAEKRSMFPWSRKRHWDTVEAPRNDEYRGLSWISHPSKNSSHAASSPAVGINRHSFLFPPLPRPPPPPPLSSRNEGALQERPTTATARGPVNLVRKSSALLQNSIHQPPPIPFPNFHDINVDTNTTPCFSKLKSEVTTVSELIAQHQAFCRSVEFDAFISLWGIDGPSFSASSYLAGLPVFERFSKAWKDLPPDSTLGIVFHGTREGNVRSILANGLDPRRRKVQAYGPGEYFSTDPGVSVSYCHGGLEMLVFLVVIPPDNQRAQNRCPHNYVVVNNNNHQLPLGSFTFKSVDRTVFHRSMEKRNRLAQLSRLAEEKTRQANVTMFKATIIQHLIGGQVDIASEKYQKHKDQLCQISQKEISMYVHRVLDSDVISFYFPELPAPMMAEERDVAAIKSVDETLQDAAKAKELLEKATLAESTQN